MKKTVRYSLLGLAAVSITAAWLSLGLFQDREFATIYLFTKHRVSLKMFFYAPLGESDNLMIAPKLKEIKKPNKAIANARERFSPRRKNGTRRMLGNAKPAAGILWRVRDLRVGV